MSKKRNKSPKIIAVGGGKGGVGKSLVSVNLASAIAKVGYKTIIIDLDLGGANLHTLLGMTNVQTGVGNYLYDKDHTDLSEYCIPTPQTNLSLISGSGFIPGLANIEHQRKSRLIRAIMKLRADYVILDIGAGTNYNVIDFFAMTQCGIVVTLPEPTAIFNAYEFLKNVVFRSFSQHFKKDKQISSIIKAAKELQSKPNESDKSSNTVNDLIKNVRKVDPSAAYQMQQICKNFQPHLVLNVVRETNLPENISKSFYDICRQHLNLNINFLGSVPQDDMVRKALQAMKPVVIAYPDAISSHAFKDIKDRCLNQNWLDKKVLTTNSQRMALENPEQLQRIKDIINSHHTGVLSSLMHRFLIHAVQIMAARQQINRKNIDNPLQLLNSDVARFLNLPARVPKHYKEPGFIPVGEEAPRSFLQNVLYGNQEDPEVTPILEIPTRPNQPAVIEQVFNTTNKDEKSAAAWCRVALLFVSHHDLTLAQKCFYNAMHCAPEKKRELNNYAASLLHNGLIQPAIETLEKGLPRYQYDMQFSFNTGLAYFLKNDFHEAHTFLDRACRAQNNDTPLFLTGYSLFRCHEYEHAKERFLSLFEIDPLNTDALFNGALSALKAGQNEDAFTHFERHISIKPTDHAAYAGAALACWKLEQDNDTLDFLNRAVDRAAPGYINYRLARAIVAYKNEIYDTCVNDIQTICALLPKQLKLKQLYLSIRKILGC